MNVRIWKLEKYLNVRIWMSEKCLNVRKDVLMLEKIWGMKKISNIIDV